MLFPLLFFIKKQAAEKALALFKTRVQSSLFALVSCLKNLLHTFHFFSSRERDKNRLKQCMQQTLSTKKNGQF